MNESARNLLRSGQQARQEGRFTEAKRDLLAGIELLRPEASDADLARAVRTLAEVERRLDERSLAIAHYEEAVKLCRRTGNPLFLAHTVRHLADVHVELGQLEQAEPYYQEALELYRANPGGPRLDYANAVRASGVHQEAVGNLSAAKESFTEAGALYKETGIEEGVAEMKQRLDRLAAAASKT